MPQPTEAQFEAAARAAGVRIDVDERNPWRDGTDAPPYVALLMGTEDHWRPHIPGRDNAMLAAALDPYETKGMYVGDKPL